MIVSIFLVFYMSYLKRQEKFYNVYFDIIRKIFEDVYKKQLIITIFYFLLTVL